MKLTPGERGNATQGELRTSGVASAPRRLSSGRTKPRRETYLQLDDESGKRVIHM